MENKDGRTKKRASLLKLEFFIKKRRNLLRFNRLLIGLETLFLISVKLSYHLRIYDKKTKRTIILKKEEKIIENVFNLLQVETLFYYLDIKKDFEQYSEM